MANRVADSQQDAYYSLEAHEKKSRTRSRRLTTMIAVVAVFIVLAAGALAAWNYLRPPDIAQYASQTVTLVGLGDVEREISPEQLVELPCQSVSARGASDRTGQGTIVEKTALGYGPTLQDVIAQWGYSLDDFDRVVVRCRDSYEVVILPRTRLEGEVYLSLARGKDALPEEMRPMRLIMPDMPSGQWAYGIDTISFEKRR